MSGLPCQCRSGHADLSTPWPEKKRTSRLVSCFHCRCWQGRRWMEGSCAKLSVNLNPGSGIYISNCRCAGGGGGQLGVNGYVNGVRFCPGRRVTPPWPRRVLVVLHLSSALSLSHQDPVCHRHVRSVLAELLSQKDERTPPHQTVTQKGKASLRRRLLKMVQIGCSTVPK